MAATGARRETWASPWRAVRHRPWQSSAVLALATLVTALTVVGPLYQRAMLQSATELTLSRATDAQTAVRIAAPNRQEYFAPLPGPAALARVLPARFRSLFAAPVASRTVTLTAAPGQRPAAFGDLSWATDACAHLVLVSGRCPDADLEIAVSTADAGQFGLGPGSRVQGLEVPLRGAPDPDRVITLRVVGTYRQPASGYWAGRDLTGLSGYVPPGTTNPLHDTWLTADATFTGAAARRRWAGPDLDVTYALVRDRVGFDQLTALGPALVRATERAADDATDADRMGQPGAVPADVTTKLPQLATALVVARRQAAVTVPLLLVQVDLLSVMVLWLVLAAVADQRRPEVAVARLTGLGPRGAGRLLLGELLPAVGLGVVAGVGGALLLAWAARTLVLPGSPPFEVTGTAVLALGVDVVLLVVVAVLGTRRVSREQVLGLLRRVPARRGGWRFGTGEAVVAAAAATLVAAFVAGGLSGGGALVGPSAVALLVGVVLGRLVVPASTYVGRVLVRRGRTGPGVGTLMSARRTASGLVVTMVTVAAALAVFGADTWSVASRNWTADAQQDVGAPTVVTLATHTLGPVRLALARLPADVRRHVTPVARVSGGTVTELAVVPSEFRRISYVGTAGAVVPRRGIEDAWGSLSGERWPRVEVTGRRVSVRVTRVDLGGGRRPRLYLDLVTTEGDVVTVDLGRVPAGPGRLAARVPCRTGCEVVGIGVQPPASQDTEGSLVISAARAPGGHTNLTELAGAFRVRDKDDSDRVTPLEPSPGATGAILLSVSEPNGGPAEAVSQRVPATYPVLMARTSVFATESDVQGVLLAGRQAPLDVVGLVPRLPGGGREVALVDLDVLQRSGGVLSRQATAELWVDTDRPAVLSAVRRATAGVAPWSTVRTVADARAERRRAVPAWSLQLGLFVGLAGLLVTALAVLVLVLTTWRLRSRDLAALRMAGVRVRTLSRAGVVEQVGPVLVGVVAGSLCGWVGAHLALPLVPLFVTRPSVSTLDLATSWPAVAAGVVVGLVATFLPAYAAGRALARRAGVGRLREPT